MADENTQTATMEGSGPAPAASAAPQQAGGETPAATAVSEPTDLRGKLEKIHAEKTATAVVPPTTPETPPPGEVPVPPAYVLNAKYKAMGEEREMEKWLQELIKDEETEKKVRDLVERAAGVDHYLPQFKSLKQEHLSLTKGLDVINGHLQNKDYGKFFGAFGLTDLDVLRYAQERVKYLSLPEDQRAALDAQQAQRDELARVQAEQATVAEMMADLRSQNLDMGLRMVMQHPQVTPVIASYPGGEQAFYRDVAQNAFVYEVQTGQEISPDQAVMLFMQQRGLSASAGQVAMPPAQVPGAPVQGQVATPASQPAQLKAEPAPTLPKVPSQGTSPAKKMVSNMQDLLKARDAAVAAQG